MENKSLLLAIAFLDLNVPYLAPDQDNTTQSEMIASNQGNHGAENDLAQG